MTMTDDDNDDGEKESTISLLARCHKHGRDYHTYPDAHPFRSLAFVAEFELLSVEYCLVLLKA